MNKFTKQLLTGVVALGLIAPVATQAINVNSPITVNAKRRHHTHHHIAKHHLSWHYGVPAALKGKWETRITRMPKHSPAAQVHYKIQCFINIKKTHQLFSPSSSLCRNGKYYAPTDTYGEAWDPYYAYLGHGTYKLLSSNGSSMKDHSLHNDLDTKDVLTIMIHTHGHNRFKATMSDIDDKPSTQTFYRVKRFSYVHHIIPD